MADDVYVIQKETLMDLADAIRAKANLTSNLTTEQMVSIITALSAASTQPELLAQLRASFTENIGGNYSDKTWEELIGNPPIEGFSNNGYNSGVLYNLRMGFSNLATRFTDLILNDPISLNGSLTTIGTAIDDVHLAVITALNAIINPDEPYDYGTPWTDILTAVDDLPTFVTESLTDSSDELRQVVDTAISEIITEYGLTVETVTGTWQNTLTNLTAVCEAINQNYEDLISGMEEILGITEGDSDE